MLNVPLRTAVADVARVARPQDLHLVQVSSSGATGAVILHAWVAGEHQPRVVVKTPRDSRLHHTLRLEWDAVCAVREGHGVADFIPAAVATFELGGAEFFIYAGAPGRTMYSRYRNRMLRSRAAMLDRFALQALGALVRIHATSSRAASAEEVALDLHRDLAWLERTLHDLPRGVSQTARTMAQRLAGCRERLPLGRVHGDFSPYNLITTGMRRDARVAVIDWEHSEPERPQHLDVFRFAAACALMGLRGHARSGAFAAMTTHEGHRAQTLLDAWLVRMGASATAAWLDPPMLEALWWHYWIHAARREQERRAIPADCAGATYVPALSQLAEQASPPWHYSPDAFAT